jgi:methyl-accepting chemotaxis protein
VSIRDLVKDVQTKSDRTLQITRNIKSTISKTEQQLSHLPQLASVSNDIASAVAKLANDTSSAQQELLTVTNSSSVRFKMFLSQWEELAPTVSHSELI